MSILVEHLDIEVWIWSNEVEYIALPHVSPVFPAYIPSLYKHLVKTILRSKVDITLYLLIVCSMTTIGLYLLPVDLMLPFRNVDTIGSSVEILRVFKSL